MKTIILSNEVMYEIRKLAMPPFIQTGQRLPDGMWAVPVSDDLFDFLNGMGPDPDMVCRRLLKMPGGTPS